MEVRLKLEHPLAKLPERKHVTDAGYDCYAVDMRTDEFGNLVYSLGFSIEIPVGFVGLLFPRSSCSSTDLIMANCVGVIDSGYRGIVSAKFKTLNTEAATKAYEVGDRVCQLIIIGVPDIRFALADQLEESDRGVGGYGSTGR